MKSTSELKIFLLVMNKFRNISFSVMQYKSQIFTEMIEYSTLFSLDISRDIRLYSLWILESEILELAPYFIVDIKWPP